MNTNYTYDLPPNYYFGGGGDTFATPLAVAILALACILIISLPRKYAFIPFLLAGLLIPLDVSVVIAKLHFNEARLLILAGWIRLLIRKEHYPTRLNTLDKVILYGALVSAVDYVLLWREFGAVVNRLGILCDVLGSYFLLRCLVRSKDDVIRAIKVFAVVLAIVAPAMWHENRTQHNLFSLVGTSELTDDIREGKVRARGPFGASIIAGTLGVVSIPLFVGLWWARRGKLLPALGIASACVMMVACTSSTPVMSLPAGILALFLWPLRRSMRAVRYGLVALLVVLQLMMKVPVWFVIERITLIVGGSGYHRAMLIDHFIRHFFEWCLIGTNNNQNWGWSMWDVDNAFVGAGINGGLLGFVLFLCIFIYGYGTIGKAWRRCKSRRDACLVWAIGAALFANTVGFFGIVYFDQSFIAWYALLVMIQVTGNFPAVKPRAAAEEDAVQERHVELLPTGAWD